MGKMHKDLILDEVESQLGALERSLIHLQRITGDPPHPLLERRIARLRREVEWLRRNSDKPECSGLH